MIGQKKNNFLAPISVDAPLTFRNGLECSGDTLQNSISRTVSAFVVHLFEVIKIDKDSPERSTVYARLRYASGHIAIQRFSIQQMCQVINARARQVPLDRHSPRDRPTDLFEGRSKVRLDTWLSPNHLLGDDPFKLASTIIIKGSYLEVDRT